MKTITLIVSYYEKGEYVRTPEGVGIVAEDELPIENVNDLFYSQIKVQHKEGTSSNTSNSVISMDKIIVHRITKEEYEND